LVQTVNFHGIRLYTVFFFQRFANFSGRIPTQSLEHQRRRIIRSLGLESVEKRRY
jgi:hypothetical protein